MKEIVITLTSGKKIVVTFEGEAEWTTEEYDSGIRVVRHIFNLKGEKIELIDRTSKRRRHE